MQTLQYELVQEIYEKFHRNGKLKISPKAFKKEATSSNTSAAVKLLVENTNSCFNQHYDSLHELYDAVYTEY